MKLPDKYCGKWRIVQMEKWDHEYIDLVFPGNLTLTKNEMGSLHFGAIDADLDFRSEPFEDGVRIDFSLEGEDDGSPVSGRGWAKVTEGKMKGRIFFHFGEESDFVAAQE
ncbi:MAG: hypothetical protein V1800_06035 [Candidatus Latescibacterota bacterium]